MKKFLATTILLFSFYFSKSQELIKFKEWSLGVNVIEPEFEDCKCGILINNDKLEMIIEKNTSYYQIYSLIDYGYYYQFHLKGKENKAYLLTVEKNNKYAIFTYPWDKEIVDDFPSMVSIILRN